MVVKTDQEIVTEVVQHIKDQGGRSMDEYNDICLYLNDDGRTCGHSHFVDNCVVDKASLCTATSARELIVELGDQIHLEAYRGKSESFWQNIQFLHDHEDYWTENYDLSPLGINFCNKYFNVNL